MSTYVLVHGAWHGGWCWREVAALLRAQGHTVHTPSLSGNAEHGHQNSADITLETHVRDVLGVFQAEGIERAVLVGHSYGGMVITSVAHRIPAQVERLVYLDAFVPRHGESLIDLIRRTVVAEAVPVYIEHFYSALQNAGQIPPIPGEMFGQTPATTARMARFCNPQSLATFTLPALLSGAGADIPKRYILAGTWQPSPFPAMAAEVAKFGVPVTTITGGHCLMMDAPQATADALMTTA